MKKLSVLIVAVVVVLCGCGGERLKTITSEVTVVVERSVETDRDPSITIAAKNAKLDYEKRTILIENPYSIKGSNEGNGWVVKKMDFEKSYIVIYLDSDTPYHVRIGEQYHYVSAIIKEGKQK